MYLEMALGLQKDMSKQKSIFMDQKDHKISNSFSDLNNSRGRHCKGSNLNMEFKY